MMELDEIVVKESPGLCRCCLSEGCYKDLGTEYSWMNDTEIYADMLLECFDISISQHNEGPNGPNRLICEVCITRLRDACNFKKQVVESEKKFVDMIGRGEFRPKVVIYQQAPMKTEKVVQETMGDDIEVEYLDEDIDFEDDLPLSETITHEPSVSDDVTVSSLKLKTKRGRPKKTSTVKTEKKAKTAKLEDKPRTSKAVTKDVSQSPEETDVKPKGRNLLALFNYTTILPFNWQSNYICFFCERTVQDYEKFRIHTNSHYPCQPGNPALRTNNVIKLDISVITCKLCDDIFDDINSVIAHLVRKHSIAYNNNITMRFAMYILIDHKCFICNDKFDDFESLVQHNNVRHSVKTVFNKATPSKSTDCKQYKCYHCDTRFKNILMLIKHRNEVHNTDKVKRKEIKPAIPQSDKCTAKEIHQNIEIVLQMTTAMPFKYVNNTLKCVYCIRDTSFPNHTDLRDHNTKEHKHENLKRDFSNVIVGKTFKLDITDLTCRVCRNTFEDLDAIIDHLIENHEAKYNKKITKILQPFKLADDLACVVCKKEFTYLNILLQHMIQDHGEKTFLCPHCGEKFTTDNSLARHVNKTHETKTIACKECSITFTTSHKLKCHRAIVHNQAFPCSVCNEKFLTDYDRQKHLIKTHKMGHSCPQCDKVFVKNSVMKQHLQRYHLKERKLECNMCQKKFFTVVLLKHHMLKHAGERKHKCNECGKSYLWKKNLKNHIDNVHSAGSSSS